MLLGYIIVRALLPLVAVFGRLPCGASSGYARLLNAATRPFDLINYLGPCAAVHVYGAERMAAKLDCVLADLHRRLDAAAPADLARGMHCPARWDPFFTGYMTLADLFRYPTRHYDFHRRQLTLTFPALSRVATVRRTRNAGRRRTGRCGHLPHRCPTWRCGWWRRACFRATSDTVRSRTVRGDGRQRCAADGQCDRPCRAVPRHPVNWSVGTVASAITMSGSGVPGRASTEPAV